MTPKVYKGLHLVVLHQGTFSKQHVICDGFNWPDTEQWTCHGW